MKLFWLWMASLLVARGFGQAPDDTKIPAAEIMRQEEMMTHAQNLGDAAAMANLLDSFGLFVDREGTLQTKTQFLAALKEPAARLEPIRQSIRITFWENTAVVTGIYRAKDQPDGTRQVQRGRFTHVWVRENGVWRCAGAQATPLLP